MRIVIVSETYFPQINGVSRTLDRLVSHLREQGDEVHLLIPRYATQAPVADRNLGVTSFAAVALPFYREILLPLVTPGTIRRELEAVKPDVVHIATEGPLGWAALRAARKLGLPLVSSYHTNFSQYLRSYRLGLLEPVAWRYLRWLHNATAVTFCPTPSIQAILTERGFERVHTWGRGVDSERFSPAKRDLSLRRKLGFNDGDLVFLYVGRLAAEKNLGMLATAFSGLAYARARLLVVGDGPMRKRVEEEVGPRGVFVGYKQGEELARLYAAADVMVFPSLTDTFGNVMLEAMASGLPVIGFRVPGPMDVIQAGLTGEVLPEVSPEALRSNMVRFLNEAGLVRDLGRQARQAAEKLNWNEINAPVRRAYQLAAAGGAPSRGELADQAATGSL